jgi:hypothetical protein
MPTDHETTAEGKIETQIKVVYVDARKTIFSDGCCGCNPRVSSEPPIFIHSLFLLLSTIALFYFIVSLIHSVFCRDGI